MIRPVDVGTRSNTEHLFCVLCSCCCCVVFVWTTTMVYDPTLLVVQLPAQVAVFLSFAGGVVICGASSLVSMINSEVDVSAVWGCTLDSTASCGAS